MIPQIARFLLLLTVSSIPVMTSKWEIPPNLLAQEAQKPGFLFQASALLASGVQSIEPVEEKIFMYGHLDWKPEHILTNIPYSSSCFLKPPLQKTSEVLYGT